MRKRKWPRWVLGIVVVLVAAAGVALWQGWITPPWVTAPAMPEGGPLAEELGNVIPTVPVQRAELIIEDLQIAGKLALGEVIEVKAPFGEAVASVHVLVGDTVQRNDVLMMLDSGSLATEMESAWLSLTAARQTLIDLMAPSTDLEMMTAQSELLAAQEALARLQEGPPAPEIASAALAVQKAQLDLEELQNRNDPNSVTVRQARYSMQQAETAVRDAQTALEAIAWRGPEESAGQAAAVQSATIALESARLAYEEAIAPPTDYELQSAQLAVNQAQNAYNELFEEATPANIAQAQLNIAKAEDAIRALEDGAPEQEIQKAEAEVLAALTKFEGIRSDLLSGSALLAPIGGLVTQVKAVKGQVVERGFTVAAIAAPNAYAVNLAVTEEYILQLKEGMPVEITVDVAPDLSVPGIVTYVASVDTTALAQGESTSFEGASTSPASYPVTVQLDATAHLDALRAGMSVQVTFVGSNQVPENGWLVPASSVQRADGESDTGTIEVLRGETPEKLDVIVTNITQGEWQVVVSTELTDSDQVVGTVSSFLGAPPQFGGFGPGF